METWLLSLGAPILRNKFNQKASSYFDFVSSSGLFFFFNYLWELVHYEFKSSLSNINFSLTK